MYLKLLLVQDCSLGDLKRLAVTLRFFQWLLNRELLAELFDGLLLVFLVLQVGEQHVKVVNALLNCIFVLCFYSGPEWLLLRALYGLFEV